MKSSLRLMPIILLSLFVNRIYGQGYVSPFKMKDGQIVMKSKDEIRVEENQKTAKVNTPKEFEKPKKGPNSKGEIWIGGYCRYRPASSSTSNFNDNLSESSYHRENFPSDTVIYSDSFNGSGNIPWVENAYGIGDEKACKSLLERIPMYANDGIPFQVYDSLCKLSYYSYSKQKGSGKGREYEFSRAVSIWIKREAGPESMYVKYTTEFPFVNSKDYLDLEINDKGKFKLSAFCDNCDDQYKEVESGTAKSWRNGQWNEITVKKDEFNNILIYANEQLLFQYRIPNIPISTHFGGFRLNMPYQWEKKGLKYRIGTITSIHYPKAI